MMVLIINRAESIMLPPLSLHRRSCILTLAVRIVCSGEYTVHAFSSKDSTIYSGEYTVHSFSSKDSILDSGEYAVHVCSSSLRTIYSGKYKVHAFD